MSYEWLLDGGYLPRPLLRMGIRKQLSQRAAEITAPSLEAAYSRKMKFIAELRKMPIAVEYIKQRTEQLGLRDVTTVLANMVDHDFTACSFDRAVAIESFEHMKNYEALLKKVSSALRPSGKLFVQTLSHRDSPYHFELEDGWMSKYFFTGGTMPSADLFLYFQDDLRVKQQWWVSGKNYARTCETWLQNWLRGFSDLWPHLVSTYGKDYALKWYYRWQVFFVACAELFAYEDGNTWGTSQYLFEK